jgi:hypothetical protein
LVPGKGSKSLDFGKKVKSSDSDFSKSSRTEYLLEIPDFLYKKLNFLASNSSSWWAFCIKLAMED